MLKKRGKTKTNKQKKQGQKNYKKYICEVCFKKRVFFFHKVIGYKSEN